MTVIALLYLWAIGLFGTHTTWHQLGPIQIVGGPYEAWCFVEVRRMVRRPGVLVEPKVINLGHSQEVIAFTPDGMKERIAISIQDGVTFHHNIGRVFWLNEAFYLFQGFSMNVHRSVYRWRGDQFELLPLAESEELLKMHGLDASGPQDIEPFPDFDGWERVFADRGRLITQNEFAWKRMTFRIEIILREAISLSGSSVWMSLPGILKSRVMIPSRYRSVAQSIAFFGAAPDRRGTFGPTEIRAQAQEVAAMKLNYYPETDSLYITLSPKPSADSNEVAAGVVLDFDVEGKLVGIDIDNASHKLDLREVVTEHIPVQADAA